jgi:peptide/nickel transport system permease protein/oligopeptide transport system permease protein
MSEEDKATGEHENAESRMAARLDAHWSPNQRAWRRFKRNKPAVLSAWFLLALFTLVLFWPLVSPYDYATLSEAQFQPPTASHWFGTDVHGRDLLTRIFYGARVSLLVGFVGAGVALLIGVAWGAVAGYIGGRLDNVLMRIVDILYSIPGVLVAIVLIAAFDGAVKKLLEKSIGAQATAYSRVFFMFLGLGAVSWLTMARIVRGQVLSVCTRAFVDASRSLGASHARVVWGHILPNVYGVIIVYLTLTIPAIILYESFLSYLGLGIQPPMASWGTLIAEGAGQLNPIRIYWWLILFPAGALISTLLALNFLGDGLRDALDPRAEKSR